MVGVGGDKFIDQVALRTHDLDAVVARALRQACRAHKVFNGLLYLFGGERVRAKGVDRRLDGAGRHQLGVVGVAAKVQYLHANLATCLVHRLGHYLVFLGFFRRGHAGAAGHGAGTVVGRNAACDHQTHAATRALGIKRGHALKAVFGLLQADVHRAHEHAVFQCGEAQVQRAEHQGVCSHKTLSKNTTSLSRTARRGASLGESGALEDCFRRQGVLPPLSSEARRSTWTHRL